MGNQKPHIEGQTVQSLKQKAQNNSLHRKQKIQRYKPLRLNSAPDPHVAPVVFHN